MARKQGARPLEGLGSLAELSFSGVAGWWDLRGADTVGHDSGVAETTQNQGFRYRSTTRGQVPIEAITYDFGASNPNDMVMRQARIARDRNRLVNWRHTFYAEELMPAVAARTFQVTAAGAAPAYLGDVTIAGAQAQDVRDLFASSFVEGDSIIFGGLDASNERIVDAAEVYTIEQIDLEDDGTLSAIAGQVKVVQSLGGRAAAHAAAMASVRGTGARLMAACKVLHVGSFNAGSTGDTPVRNGIQLLPAQAIAQAIPWFGDEP